MRRGLLALAAIAAACGQDIGPPSPWVDVAAVQGPLKPEEEAAPPALGRTVAPDRLRVVTWNVEFGKQVDEMAAVLNQEPLASAGLVLLQEEEAYPEEHGSRSARLAAAIAASARISPRTVTGSTRG